MTFSVSVETKQKLKENKEIKLPKILGKSHHRVASDFFEKNQVQFKNNSRIFQVHFWAAIFPHTTQYNDRQAHLKLTLLPFACSKIVFILCSYPITFLKQLVKSKI